MNDLPTIVINGIIAINGNNFLTGKIENFKTDNQIIRIPIPQDVCNRILMEFAGEFETYIGHPDVERDAAIYME
jgi:hypothetical protein